MSKIIVTFHDLSTLTIDASYSKIEGSFVNYHKITKSEDLGDGRSRVLETRLVARVNINSMQSEITIDSEEN